MNPNRFGNVLHDDLQIRLAPNDRNGTAVIISNHDYGLVLLFSVPISLNDLELIPLLSENEVRN